MAPDADTESARDDRENPAPVHRGPGWPWLPTMDGALKRDLVTGFTVERQEGTFKGGANSVWLIKVKTAANEDGISLRPTFFDASELGRVSKA